MATIDQVARHHQNQDMKQLRALLRRDYGATLENDMSTHQDLFGWIGAMLRHDAGLNRREQAPTGDDYNAIFPTDLGFIWHTLDDIGDFYEHAVNITRHNGLIRTVTERDDGLIDVVFAIHHHDYAAMLGREPDAEEWLDYN